MFCYVHLNILGFLKDSSFFAMATINSCLLASYEYQLTSDCVTGICEKPGNQRVTVMHPLPVSSVASNPKTDPYWVTLGILGH